MEIHSDYLYQLIGQMVVYKEALEKQVDTLKQNIVLEMQKNMDLKRQIKELQDAVLEDLIDEED